MFLLGTDRLAADDQRRGNRLNSAGSYLYIWSKGRQWQPPVSKPLAVFPFENVTEIIPASIKGAFSISKRRCNVAKIQHWCKSYNPKPNASSNCGDCYNYNMELSYCPKNFSAQTSIVHPPVKARGKKSVRITGVLK